MTTKKDKAKAAILDLRDVLPRGRNGEGVIDGAKLLIDKRQSNPVWEIDITIDDKEYRADRCFLQTEEWKPKKGDLVRFDRQPEGVSDQYLHATLLGA